MTDKKKFEGGEEVESNWMKFLKVGDGIKGTLVGKRFMKSNKPSFPDQWIYQIINSDDGQEWNVGVSEKKIGTISRLNKCATGEVIAIVFESEGGSAVKGGAPAKNLKVLTYGMDAEFVAGLKDTGEEI